MKNIPWIITGAALIALVIVLLSNRKGDPAEIGYIPDSTQYWKNRAGQLVASLKQREEDFNVVEKGWKDSVAKLHNTTAARIQAAISLALSGRAEVPAVGPPVIEYKYRDTSGPCLDISSMSQLFLSPYYMANAYIGIDTSLLTLQTYDTLHLVVKEVKEGNIFNRRQYLQLDVRNANPYNLVTGLKMYRVPALKPKRWGIGPQIGVTLDGSGQVKPYAGIGINYSLIRF